MLFDKLISPYTRQRRLQRRLPGKAVQADVREYLQTPLPASDTPYTDVEYLALDFETTGLNARKEAILSMGWTVIRKQCIHLQENNHHIIKVNRPLADDSIIIHKITEERAQSGEHIHQVMPLLLREMAGRVLLVHYAAIEKTFLDQVCKQLYGFTLPLLIVDTFALEYNYLQKTGQVIVENQLRLANLRKQYGLPRYQAHNALMDALATAELFLAQMQYKQADAGEIPLKDILR